MAENRRYRYGLEVTIGVFQGNLRQILSVHRYRKEIALHRLTAVMGRSRFLPGERRTLSALAQYPHGRSKAQVAVLTGYAPNGGGFDNYLSGDPR